MPRAAVDDGQRAGASCTQPPSNSTLMHPLQRSLTLLRWRRATPFVFIALVLILLRAASNIPYAFSPPQTQTYHLGGCWKDAHAALGLSALPDSVPGLAVAADVAQHTAFVPRFDLRKRAALVREARSNAVPLFLAQDALREPMAALEEMRRAFREQAGRPRERDGQGSGRKDNERESQSAARHRAVYSPFRGNKGGR